MNEYVLITGGTGQGKTAYAFSLFAKMHPGETPVVYDAVCPDGKDREYAGRICRGTERMEEADILLHMEQWILREIQKHPDWDQNEAEDCVRRQADMLFSAKPACVITLAELGCGVVPMKRQDRIWRETAGRFGCLAAERSDQVIRMICGVAQIIKTNRQTDAFVI